jgi:hypothetical protein
MLEAQPGRTITSNRATAKNDGFLIVILPLSKVADRRFFIFLFFYFSIRSPERVTHHACEAILVIARRFGQPPAP